MSRLRKASNRPGFVFCSVYPSSRVPAMQLITTRRRGAIDLRKRLFWPPRRERDNREEIDRRNDKERVNREGLDRDGSLEERNIEAARKNNDGEGRQLEEENIWRRKEWEVIERARQDREIKEEEIRRRFEIEMAAVERDYERDVVKAREDKITAERAIEGKRDNGQGAKRVNGLITTRRRGAIDLRKRLFWPPRRERDNREEIDRRNDKERVNREGLDRDGSLEERNIEAARKNDDGEGRQLEEENIWRRKEREVIERARQDREIKEEEIRRRFEIEMAAVERDYERDVVKAREDKITAERAIEGKRDNGQGAKRVNG
ncbi:uncharacterized protein [Watersipora subatra]|uniref:uncharacterized protein n=1 Tax=Watersipora subatra TaxID=2589382 RepID=UPI00355ADC44